MPVYLIGIGSNIQPEQHIPLAQQALARIASILDASPVVTTPADGPHFSGLFQNQLVALQSPASAAELKNRLLAIEESLGREPKSPQRRYHDRTIDLDILLEADHLEDCLKQPLEDIYYQSVLEHWQQTQKLQTEQAH